MLHSYYALDEDRFQLAALDALKEHYKSKGIEEKRTAKSATVPKERKASKRREATSSSFEEVVRLRLLSNVTHIISYFR